MRLLLIDRVCEEFGCLPTQAARELETDAEDLALTLLDVRQYLRCKAAYDASPDEQESRALDAWRDSPMLELVKRHTRELIMGGLRGGQRR